jgi:hypothetical protein
MTSVAEPRLRIEKAMTSRRDLLGVVTMHRNAIQNRHLFELRRQ